MLWLYLLAAVTVLSIALRRVLRRQKPLNDELYLQNVAVEHVHSGVAWIRADGTFGSVNQSFAQTFRGQAHSLIGREWFKMFPPEQHGRVREVFSQMLLAGIATFDGPGLRVDGTEVWINVRLVGVHDHHMRFVGHHCLVEDQTRMRELEERVSKLAAISLENPKPKLVRRELPLGVAR